jgi:hypothetical protein
VEEQDVVKIYDKVTVVDQIRKNRVHKGLEGSRGVAETKGHDKRFKKAKGAFNGGFPFITGFNADVVVAPADIKFSKVAGTLEFVNEVWNK